MKYLGKLFADDDNIYIENGSAKIKAEKCPETNEWKTFVQSEHFHTCKTKMSALNTMMEWMEKELRKKL